MGDDVGDLVKMPEKNKKLAYREAKPPGPPPPPDEHGAPPFWYWLLLQRANNEELLAEAAIAIAERWSIGPEYVHARTLKTLRREKSPYYDGACRLADEYCTFAGIPIETHLVVRGTVNPLRPTAPEVCEYQYADDRRCRAAAIPFTGRCAKHGGQWVDPEDYEMISRTVRDSVLELSMRAVAKVEELMDTARSEKVRLEAAQTVLRITGHDPANGGAQVVISAPSKVQINTGPSPIDVVWERLDAIAAHASAVAEELGALKGEDDILDADFDEDEEGGEF